MVLTLFVKYLQMKRLVFLKYLTKVQRDLNNYLPIISEWASQWKMQLNLDLNKQANEV